MTYPKSNYTQIRSAIKAEYISQIETHTKLKRERKETWSSYRDVRIKHIAYSMLKGHTFEQVESKWREPDSSTNSFIKGQALALYDSYMKKIVVAEDAIEVSVG